MAKADNKTEPTETAAAGAEATASPAPGSGSAKVLVMGELVKVQPGPGAKLINNETGQFFSDTEPAWVYVTVTLLRRLADGDLVLV